MLLNLLYFSIEILIIVFVHEFGHYIVAKKFGVKIIEFSIGFGRQIFSYKNKAGEIFKICLLPFGGYVKMFGDNNASGSFGYKQKPTKDDLKYSMAYKHPIKKILISFAGPFMNILLAFILFVGLFTIKGIHKVEPIITQISSKSIAENIGLKIGDRIISINNYNIDNFNDIRRAITKTIDNELKIKIERNNKQIDLNTKYHKVSILGIAGDRIVYKKTTPINAIQEAFNEVWLLSKTTCIGFINMIIHHNTNSIGGPISIAKQSTKAAKTGVSSFIYFIAIISISLGVINLFPIPLLDGGHILFSLIELIINKKIPNKIYKISLYLGLIVVGFLIFIGFFNDIFIHR